ncbi:MAG: DUF502 domain-containing protein [Alphaproteobacteria bacterium]
MTMDQTPIPGAPLPVPPRKRSLLARLRNYFLAGVLVTAPLGITAWLIYSFVDYVDTTILPLIPEPYNPENFLEHSVPGLGVLILLVVITLIGAFVTNFLGRFMVRTGERLLARVPIVRSIYGLIKQVLDAVLAQSSTAFREVVLVEYPRKDVWVIGFVTSTPNPEIREKVGANVVYVFVPTSPNPTSGFLLVVQEAEVVRLKMSVEEGIKLVISGGIVSTPEENNKVDLKETRKAHKVAGKGT